MHLRCTLQLCLLLLLHCFLVSGKAVGKEKKKSKGGKKDELHKFQYKCNAKGVCKYKFTLTVPRELTREVAVSNDTAVTPTVQMDEGVVKEIQSHLESLKNYIENATQATELQIDFLRKANMENMERLMTAYNLEINNMKMVIMGLQNQTRENSEIDELKMQIAELQNQSAVMAQIEELKMQMATMKNQTDSSQKLDEVRAADESSVIGELRKQIADLQKEGVHSDETEKLKKQVADLQKQIKRGQKKQRKLNEQLTELKNTAMKVNDSTPHKIVHAGSSLDKYADEYKKNFSSLSIRVNNVERLFYGYASGDKYIYLMKPSTPRKRMPSVVGQDCSIMRKRGLRQNGVYEVKPDPDDESLKFFAYCDMYTDGGGWTMIQRRQGGKEDFNRNWQQYKDGFGDNEGEFWLGLEKIYQLSQNGNNEIRFDMWDFHNKHKYATYKDFRLANETDEYRIEVGQYKGTAGDAFHYANVFLQQNRQQFTTKDNDNDKMETENCAVEQKGGWWYQKCGAANLNGNYYANGVHLSDKRDGILWQPWHLEESLRRTEIKIRPMDF